MTLIRKATWSSYRSRQRTVDVEAIPGNGQKATGTSLMVGRSATRSVEAGRVSKRFRPDHSVGDGDQRVVSATAVLLLEPLDPLARLRHFAWR